MSDHRPSLPSSGVGVSGQFIISARVGDGGKMSVPGVRRAKAAFFSGCKSHPATIAPAGSNRSSHGGNEVAEASGVEGHIW